MRVLEIGTYVAPAYAGMIMAEQGHDVTKWIYGSPDPVRLLRDGDHLWSWLSAGKRIITVHASEVAALDPGDVDLIIDNVRADTWTRWGIDPRIVARSLGVVWVSLRDDLGGRSFDAIAQARAWGDHLGYLPVYLGDTVAGLWLAYKAMAAPPGHHVIHQAACLAKMVEGELVLDPDRSSLATPPWDAPGTYGRTDTGVVVEYRGEKITEPYRDQGWRRRHLRHVDGRIIV